MSTFPISPSADALLIGAGIMFWNPFDDNGAPTNWHDMGDINQVTTGLQDETLVRRNSRIREGGIYARRLQSREMTISINVAEHSRENLRLKLMASLATYVQTADPVVDEVLSESPVTGVVYMVARKGAITSVTVKRGEDSLVLNTDYILDPRFGFIRLLNTTGSGDLTISYTPQAVTAGDVLRLGTQPVIEGALRFIGDPKSGPRSQMDLWKVSINPEGALNLISEEFSEGVLQATVLEDAATHPNSPYGELIALP